MRLLYETIPPANPVTIAALAALFTFCALIVAIGMVKLVDAISRSFFGTIGGAIGWIPFAGKVVQHSLHKIEQKISHGLGSAERKLDAGVAWTWNNCAHLVAYVGTELEGLAKGSWHIAQQLKGFVTPARLDHVVKANTRPANAKVANVAKAQRADHAHGQALAQSVAQGVYPRLRQAENEITHVLEPDIAALRSRTKALEHGAVRTFDWIRAHKFSVATAAFVGAVSFALTKLGGGWIRCSNWRKLGRAVCRLPSPLIDALIVALLAEFAFANLDTLMRLSAEIIDETTGELFKALGLPALPNGRFTIE